jgi:DNA polymerase I-like protein with 3'-5' exonuclease and polymerase domains
MPLSIAPNAVALDYVVNGPRTAAAVAAGRSPLIGLVIQDAGQEPRFVDCDLAGLLDSLGDRQRLYPSALFALAVEAANDLPSPSDFHDFHALCCLLYGHDPFQWQPGNEDRAGLVRLAQEKTIPFASYAQFLDNTRQERLDSVYEQIELPVIVPTLAMTLAGVPFNAGVLAELVKGPAGSHAAALLRHAQPDGRVYADLDPMGAVTGRYTCQDPNLQGLATPVRAAVEASPNCVLMEADVSQCELRVLAHFSQDAGLLAAYREGIDLHRQTAAAVLGIAEVSAEQRRIGKQVNFAIVYGMTADGLAQKLGIMPCEAQRLLDGYFAAYPGVRSWIAQVHTSAQVNREVRTLSGRRRRLPDIRSRDPAAVATAQRQAVNTIVQGTAADLMKLALIRLHQALPPEVRLLMTAHDSVLLELPERLVAQTRDIVLSAMQSPPPNFGVPVHVDVKTGRTRADCKQAQIQNP